MTSQWNDTQDTEILMYISVSTKREREREATLKVYFEYWAIEFKKSKSILKKMTIWMAL